jgi:hypothetical protein
MDVNFAAYHLVKDAGGAKVVAAMLADKSESTLAHEVNPRDYSAKLGLDDAVRMSVLTKDSRILSAFAAECGFVVTPMPSTGDPEEMPDETGALMSGFGEFIASAGVAYDDPTPNKLRAVERNASTVVSRIQSVLKALYARAGRADGARPRDEDIKLRRVP